MGRHRPSGSLWDPLFLWPWELPRQKRWHDNTRLWIAIFVLLGLAAAGCIRQLVAGPDAAWLWAIPGGLASCVAGLYFLIAILQWEDRPQVGTPDAKQMLDRAQRRRARLKRR